MRRLSLRARLLALAAAGVAVALAATGVGIAELFARHLSRRVGVELDAHISQIAGNLARDGEGALALPVDPGDPRFERAYSGLYWQVADERAGAILRSLSLWDGDLPAATGEPPIGVTIVRELRGPAGESLLVHERRVAIGAGSEPPTVRISVGASVADIQQMRADFLGETLVALSLLGLLLLAGLLLQVQTGLVPLARLRAAVAAVRRGEAAALPAEFPAEVLPLVEEINVLLAAKHDETERARNRAADLAHGLKTPLTVLAADIRRLRNMGKREIADEIDGVAMDMRRHVERQLAAARRRHSPRGADAVPVRPAAEKLARTLARLPHARRLRFELALDGKLTAAMTADDLNDVLGNLLENAAKNAASRIVVSATDASGRMTIMVDDDGRGVDPGDLPVILARGGRLDERGGSGLGLAIAGDILDHYDAALIAGRSALGGLAIGFALPGAVGPPSRSANE